MLKPSPQPLLLSLCPVLVLMWMWMDGQTFPVTLLTTLYLLSTSSAFLALGLFINNSCLVHPYMLGTPGYLHWRIFHISLSEFTLFYDSHPATLGPDQMSLLKSRPNDARVVLHRSSVDIALGFL